MLDIGGLCSIDASGRFGKPCEFGYLRYGWSNYGDEFIGIEYEPFGTSQFGETTYGNFFLLSGVYAHRKCAEGNIIQRRSYSMPIITNDPDVQDSRDKFALAVARWQGLTYNEKLAYNRRSVGRHMSGYNLSIREYMLS